VVTISMVSLTAKLQAQDMQTFKLMKGIGACASLPQTDNNFECKAIGWPDQNSRVDLIKQEFVEKNGKQVRWGQFDYYYFFSGVKKCESHKSKILSHLKERKDVNELLEGLGADRDCIRQGRGWIQTRNVEIWTDKTEEKNQEKNQEKKEETSVAPKQDYMTVELKKVKSSSKKTTVIKYDEEREPQSSQEATIKSPTTERLPKEYF